jgi:serine/threonine protein kinase
LNEKESRDKLISLTSKKAKILYNDNIIVEKTGEEFYIQKCIEEAEKKKTFFFEPSCDIYSIGMILWELETSQTPFKDKDNS